MTRSGTRRRTSEAGGSKTRALPDRILLATDGYDDSILAARAAADLSRRAGAELHLVHAWSDEIPRAYMITMPGARADWCEQKAKELLAREAERVKELGGKVGKVHPRRGRTADETTSLARELGAGLIVVGSRGLGPVGRLVLGSVSEGVARNAPCPVLLMGGGPHAWPPARVVVGVDFSEESVEAARLAASIGGLFGAEMLLIHAYPILELAHKAWAPGVVTTDRDVRTARETLGWLAEELKGGLRRDPETKTVAGNAADCILAATREGREPVLVAVGGRGLGTLERLTLGSVSDKVTRTVEGPVLVCRRSLNR